MSVSVALNVIPWPTAFQSPGIVDYADLATVRAGASGFITDIHVHDGQIVREGDVLLELKNDELALECRDLEIALEHADAKFRVAQNASQFGTAQVEEQNRQAIARQLAEKNHQLSHLQVLAPRSGRIIARELSSRHATFAKAGDVLLEIGDEPHKEIQFSASQTAIVAFQSGHPMTIRLTNGKRFQATLKTLSPRGSDEPPHPALCAPFGGPLTVVERAATDNKEHQQKEYRFPEPRMTGTCSIPDNVSEQLHAGAVISVSPDSVHQTIGTTLIRWISRAWQTFNTQRDSI